MASEEIRKKTEEELAEARAVLSGLAGMADDAPAACGDYQCSVGDVRRAVGQLEVLARANMELSRGSPEDFARRMGIISALLATKIRGVAAAPVMPAGFYIAAGLILGVIIVLLCGLFCEDYVARPIRNFIYSPLITHQPYDLVAYKMN